MNAFIIHGIEGHSEENWFPWLKDELNKINIDAVVPQFPNDDNPKLDEWLDFFKKYENNINEDSILVGHSLGVSFILNFLEKNNKKIKAAFFTAGFTGKIDNGYNEKMKSFIDKEFDFEKIEDNCKKFFIYNSDNDPYVPLEKGKELARNLDSELIIVNNAGHFNAEAGYTEFPLLLEDIKNLIEK